MLKATILLSAAALVIASLSGCASISEDQCLAGNWAERGYKDGAKGVSRGRLADYADTCAKYAVCPTTLPIWIIMKRGLSPTARLSVVSPAARTAIATIRSAPVILRANSHRALMTAGSFTRLPKNTSV